MRFHKRFGRVVSGFLAALTLAVSLPCASAETDRQTIRVAFPTQEGMSFFGHSGKVTGYNYDYLEKISEYTGWEMEYVPYGSTDGNEAVGSAISDLASGKVDLMGPLLKNAATEEMFEFPENIWHGVYHPGGPGRGQSAGEQPAGPGRAAGGPVADGGDPQRRGAHLFKVGEPAL